MSLPQPRTELRTPRLRLSAGRPDWGPAVADYQRRNLAHFAPWDPPAPPDFLEPAVQSERLRQGLIAFQAGVGCRWWLRPLDAPDWIIGSINLSQINQGPFCNAVLGYGLDAAFTGRGLMREALAAVIEEAFQPPLNLHRLQAAVRPENQRSLRLLQALGFEQEGLARDYLFINGAWRDHCLLARRNPGFKPPAAWALAPTPDLP